MRKMPQKPKLPGKDALQKTVITIAAKKVKFELVQRQLPEDVMAVLTANKVFSWEDTLRFLETHSYAMYSNKLNAAERKTFGILIELRRKHDQRVYDPSQFLNSSNQVPLDRLMECAQTYGSTKNLAEAVWNRHTPRADIYIAYVLGVISKEDLEKIPPKFNRARMKKYPNARKYKPKKRS
jgi:hypothetical protein